MAASEHQARSPAGTWWVAAGVIALLLALIVLATRFPPITDLPQHLAQIRLLDEQLGLAAKIDRPDVYRINWGAPNNLIYVPMWLVSRVFAPVATGKVTIWLLLCSWLSATLFLARRREREFPQTLLATVFLFNFVLYWGFLNFLMGMPLFLVWLALIGPDAPLPRSPGKLVGLSVLALLLFEAHALWFAMAAAWLGLSTIWAIIRRRERPSALVLAALILLPTVGLAAWWYPQLGRARAAAGFDVSAHWTYRPLSRLAPEFLLNRTLGGLHGVFEPLLGSFVLLWLALALWTRRGALRASIDGRLLAASAMLWLVYVAAPTKYMNTISFAERWAPVGALLLVLALPTPRLPRLMAQLPVLALAAMLAFTAWSWHEFNEETTGLQESIDAIHPPCRLLTLAFGPSERIQTSAFVQIGAYAQAIKGCELNFSFAEHGSGIVVIEGRRKLSWTPGLEWLPDMARAKDARQFDSIILGGPEEIHAQVPSILEVKPVTHEGRFRLYAPE